MNILKIFIPSGQKTEVTEVESYKVTWKVATSLMWGNSEIKYKCFINKTDAKAFKERLEEAANFIGTPINTELTRN